MARISVVALTLALLFGVPALRSAHGQVLIPSTPKVEALSPTPVPTSMPSGPPLLELMRKAIVVRRTVRVNVMSVSTRKGHAVLGWTWMDLDLQANTMREVDTTLRTRPGAPAIVVTIERRELVVSRGMAANRKPKGLWSCERLSGVRVRNTLIPFHEYLSLDGGMWRIRVRYPGYDVMQFETGRDCVPSWSPGARAAHTLLPRSLRYCRR